MSIWDYKKIEEDFKNKDSSEFIEAVNSISKLFKAKYEKALENNVITYTEKSPEIIEAINYCRNKFGKRNWYQQFQIKSKKAKENKA